MSARFLKAGFEMILSVTVSVVGCGVAFVLLALLSQRLYASQYCQSGEPAGVVCHGLAFYVAWWWLMLIPTAFVLAVLLFARKR